MDQKLNTALKCGLVRQSIEEIWNSGNLDHVEIVVHPDYVVHMPGDQDSRGIESYKDVVKNFRTAMPDVKMVIESVHCDDNYVYVTSTMEGTQTGVLKIAEGRTIEPTNKQVRSRGISRMVVNDDFQIVEEWVQWDEAAALEQLDSPAERFAYA